MYIHSKGGSAAECEHYRPLFPDCEVIGLDYQTFTPWETGAEIRAAVEALKAEDKRIILIANSIGAYFSMSAGIDAMIESAWFISPVVDMERLITDMMRWADVTEAELEARGTIHTAFGEDLSWDHLCYVRSHPSSTTLLVLSVMPTLLFQVNRKTKRQTVRRMTAAFVILFSAFMVIGRLVAGVHWLTDIVGSVLLSAGLYFLYRATVLPADRLRYRQRF